MHTVCELWLELLQLLAHGYVVFEDSSQRTFLFEVWRSLEHHLGELHDVFGLLGHVLVVLLSSFLPDVLDGVMDFLRACGVEILNLGL